MTLRDLPARLSVRVRHPQTTVRWRLTLLYGALFLACGAALLAITYTLVANATPSTPKPVLVTSPGQLAITVGRGPGFSVNALPKGAMPPTPALSVPPQVQQLLGSPVGGAVIRIANRNQRAADLHQLEIESGIALAIMAIISALLGWVVAGRVLRPLRVITATAQEISEVNLHRRLALPGPRDELRRLADTIDGLLGRLERAFESQRRFVANASHELRTPLTATRAVLEMALSDPNATNETLRSTCKQALDENEQQEQLIDALLALAHGQRGIETREPVELAAVTREVLETHRLEAAGSGVGIDASLERAVVSGDPRLLERLISNLVENAIRHNVRNGHVRVLVQQRTGDTILVIANSGPLVPAQEIERLLQPFQRLVPDRVRDGGGVGLGLSIVTAITAAHDAVLEINPGDHGGLEVQLRFPPVSETSEPISPEPGSVGEPGGGAREERPG